MEKRIIIPPLTESEAQALVQIFDAGCRAAGSQAMEIGGADVWRKIKAAVSKAQADVATIPDLDRVVKANGAMPTKKPRLSRSR